MCVCVCVCVRGWLSGVGNEWGGCGVCVCVCGWLSGVGNEWGGCVCVCAWCVRVCLGRDVVVTRLGWEGDYD